MLLLGIDLGTSSIKVSVIDSETQQCVASARYPDAEVEILAPQPGWAEQSPDQWWENVKQAILRCHTQETYDPKDIASIGIAYQMHGLVLVDKDQHVLRNSIIWCDSRAVEIGERAFQKMGEQFCLSRLLNSPGNFTASKLAWVKENEPELYSRIDKMMLPGDFIAMKLTGEITTTPSALSEGIFWDFQEEGLSTEIMQQFGFSPSLIPDIKPVFSSHGHVRETVAARLGLKKGIPVAYKSGDQPNNALSLNVLQPGEVAATAGTSGVIYGVADQLSYDRQSRINSFAHVNHQQQDKRIGILLCINGVGIFNRWIKNMTGANTGYDDLNESAQKIKPGSDGLFAMPFGNGAERMLNNRIPGAQFTNLDLNIHHSAHLVRAVQESIAFAFRYGLDIMRENGINPTVIRAAKSNLFLSEVFTSAFASVNNVAVEFYDGDGSFGSALGAGIGAGIYKDAVSAGAMRKADAVVRPSQASLYEDLYQQWKQLLEKQLAQ
ncbi:MAG: carbohydrate kinase [Chitinophagaceae bacterium]|nr:MAG: carbohydrate kinase [Chitinophagaceae bacterium]